MRVQSDQNRRDAMRLGSPKFLRNLTIEQKGAYVPSVGCPKVEVVSCLAPS